MFNKLKRNNAITWIQAAESRKIIYLSVLIALVAIGLPESALAADDAFEKMLTKVSGWVGGNFGKLVTFSSLVMAGVMGVIGFPTRYIAGAVGTGLLLASAKTLVDMIF